MYRARRAAHLDVRPQMIMPQRSASVQLAVVAALSSALIASNGATAQDSSRPRAAVVCTSEANGPWILRARGTLTRTRSKSEMVYMFKSSEHAFEWRFVTSAEGNTTAMGPGLLMDLFITAAKQSESPPSQRGPLNGANSSSELGDRRQRLSTTGEIREYAAKNALILLIGSRCPNAGRALRQRG